MVMMGDIVGFRRGLLALGLWCGDGGHRGEERKCGWCFVGVIFPFPPRLSLEGWIGESFRTGAVFGGIEKSIINKCLINVPNRCLQR